MISSMVMGVVLLLAGQDPQVVGAWGLEGEAFLRFDANGKGEMQGETFTWSTAGGVLTMTADGETETVGYNVKSGQLALTMGGIPLTFQKVGGKAAATGVVAEEDAPAAPGRLGAALGKPMGSGVGAGAQGGAKAGTTGKAGTDQLSQLLLSSAWCTFTFNKTTGYSNSSRVQFYANGTFQVGARGEGYSSGYGGSMASQHDSGSSGQWKVVNGNLHMAGADTGNQLVQVPNFSVTQNSNGSPIIKADGKEYSKCQ